MQLCTDHLWDKSKKRHASGLGSICAPFVTSETWKAFLLCRLVNLAVLMFYFTTRMEAWQRDTSADFMFRTACSACYLKCQSFGGGFHASSSPQKLQKWASTHPTLSQPSALLTHSKTLCIHTSKQRTQMENSKKDLFKRGLKKKKSCCASVKHTTPKRLNSNVTAHLIYPRQGADLSRLICFSKLCSCYSWLLIFIRLEHQIIADNVKNAW